MLEIPEYRGPTRRFLVMVRDEKWKFYPVASHEREQLTDAFIQDIYESGVAVERIKKYKLVLEVTREEAEEARRTGKTPPQLL